MKKQQESIRIVYIGQRGDKFAQIVAENEHIDDTRLIFAGKFRRYHGEGWRQLLDIKTALLNIRDIFFILAGCIQSFWLLGRLKPKVIFIKGGFVGVPVGLAAAVRRIPYVTHDSDALAGLANRIIARWASRHAVALPEDTYEYPKQKTITVGVPIAKEYSYVDAPQQTEFKRQAGVPLDGQLLFVTGGGLGAKVINDAMVAISAALLKKYPNLYIVHTTGHKHSASIQDMYANHLDTEALRRVVVKDYVSNMYVYSGAADVVVARAGATNMAELAAQGKACIIIPNPVLAGGHQLKNAEAFADAQAVKLIYQPELDAGSKVLYNAVSSLLNSADIRADLSKRLHAFAHPHAAQELSNVLLEQIEAKSRA